MNPHTEEVGMVAKLELDRQKVPEVPEVFKTNAPTERKSFNQLVQSDQVIKRFQSILKERAPQFMASLLNVVNSSDQLRKIGGSNPESIFKAAAVSAALDLPIDKNLGFAWIVPYGPVATFQMGWKGYVQLAQRTGQYLRINCVPVYKNQFKAYNSLTEQLDADFSIDGEGEPIGWAFYFKLLNGFEKTQFFSRTWLLAHGKKYSKSFTKQDGGWATNPDAMCMKTAVRLTLSKWGILSIEMRRALVADYAEIKNDNLDALDVSYLDNPENETSGNEPAPPAGPMLVKPQPIQTSSHTETK